MHAAEGDAGSVVRAVQTQGLVEISLSCLHATAAQVDL